MYYQQWNILDKINKFLERQASREQQLSQQCSFQNSRLPGCKQVMLMVPLIPARNAGKRHYLEKVVLVATYAVLRNGSPWLSSFPGTPNNFQYSRKVDPAPWVWLGSPRQQSMGDTATDGGSTVAEKDSSQDLGSQGTCRLTIRDHLPLHCTPFPDRLKNQFVAGFLHTCSVCPQLRGKELPTHWVQR